MTLGRVCIWKICSRPLKSNSISFMDEKETKQTKDFTKDKDTLELYQFFKYLQQAK